MKYFLDTSDTIPSGMGFSHFDGLHLGWLAFFVVTVILNCIWYRRLREKGKDRWRKTVAVLLIADELFKMIVLFIGGNYSWGYLPLHLCSINIFVIAIHAWKPNKLLNNFLYTICIPGAIAALLFPTWTALPLLNAMHIHSSSVHILLAMYPIVLGVAGDLKPSVKMLPKCLGLLVLMAIPIYGLNLLLDCNFMFLMSASKGNPLYWFEQNWGNHLLGFPVLITAVMIVMYVPMYLFRILRKKAEK